MPICLHRYQRIVAPAKNIFSLINCVSRIYVAHSDDRHHSCGHGRAAQRPQSAGCSAEIITECHLGRVVKIVHISGGAGKQQRLASVFSNRFLNFSGDCIECLIPCDCDKFSFASFANAFHRVKDAILSVKPFNTGQTSCAGFAVESVCIADFYDFAVFYKGFEVAMQTFHRACCLEGFKACVGIFSF